MNKLLKIAFCFNVTSDLRSFFRLIKASRQLSLSKKKNIPFSEDEVQSINLKWNHSSRRFFFRPYAGDLDIFYEIFYRKIYSLEAIKMCAEPVIVDLGANIGVASIYFLKSFPSARLLMVEPDPENIRILQQNFPVENKNSDFKIVQAAMMDFDGMIGFKTDRMKFNSHVSNSQEDYQVPAMTMNSLLNLNMVERIDLLKVDIEGSERFLFNPGYDWLDKVSNILIEIHDEPVAEKIIGLLKNAGYEITTISENQAGEKLVLARTVIASA